MGTSHCCPCSNHRYIWVTLKDGQLAGQIFAGLTFLAAQNADGALRDGGSVRVLRLGPPYRPAGMAEKILDLNFCNALLEDNYFNRHNKSSFNKDLNSQNQMYERTRAIIENLVIFLGR